MMKFNTKIIIYGSIFFLGIFSAGFASAANSVYYSVGQNITTHENGAGTVTVSGTTATFTVAQTATNMGVGDVIDYDSDNKKCYISGKTSATVWSCTNATGGAPTAATGVTVNSISHAFSSLSGALPSGSGGAKTLLGNSDLTAIDVQLNVPCYYDSGADPNVVTINGWTTDATRYIKVYTPYNTVTEVNSSQRHQGKWDTGKYRLEINDSRALVNSEDFVWIDGLQISNTNPTANDEDIIYINLANEGAETQISNNIIRGHNNATYFQKGINIFANDCNSKIWNNIIYNISNASTSYFGIWSRANYSYIYNNTIIGTNEGIYIQVGDATIKNNISYNNVDNYTSNTGWNASSTNNLSGPGADANIPAANARNGVAVSFTNTTAGSEDFHLQSTDTGAKDAGTNLSADANLPFSTDIDGQARTVNAWDIGADEYSVSGNFTLSAWVKPATTIATKAIVGKAEELRMVTDGTGHPACQIKSDGAWQTAATSSAAITVGSWAQVICSYDRIAMRVYVDGNLTGEQALTAAPDDTNSVFEIGHDASASSTYGYYSGLVDSYRFFAYAMSSDQVKAEHNFGVSMRLGSSGATSGTGAPTNAASGEYCVPGDTTACAGPVGEWNFEQNVSGNGQTLFDTSGRGNNGTTSSANGTGMNCTQNGQVGFGCEFDGVDDYVETSTGTIPPASCDYSISFWMKSNGLAPTSDPVAWGYRSFRFYNGSGTRNLSFSPDGSWWSGAISTTNMDDSQWHYVTGTVYGGGSCTNANLKIYVDGKLEGSATGNINDNYYNVGIGGAYSGAFPGQIDQVRIYDYARTPAQVAWEYNKGKPAFQYRFDEGIGVATTHNEISNSLHGAMNNFEEGDWVAGKFGTTLDFDGSDKYVDIGDTNLNMNALSFWIYADQTSDDIIDFDGGTHTITVSSNAITANGFSAPTIYVDGEESSAIATGVWSHVLVRTATAFEASNMDIGRISTGYFDGKLDDVRLYNYSPTAEQVRQIMNEGVGIKY